MLSCEAIYIAAAATETGLLLENENKTLNT